MYKAKHIYNLKRDPVDHSDKLLTANSFRGIQLPSSVDLRPECPPIFNQGDIGSCAANAGASAFNFDLYKETGKFTDLSRMALYNLARMTDGNFDFDAGTYLRTIVKVLAKYGIPPESEFPYSKDNLFVKPSADIMAAAEKYQALNYYRIPDASIMLIKAALASGFNVIFGATLYESFESDDVAKTGIVPMPNEKIESVLGGHAMKIVGYDDARQCFIDANSWGDNWGDKGYCYIPYEYIRRYGSDFWVITRTEIGM